MLRCEMTARAARRKCNALPPEQRFGAAAGVNRPDIQQRQGAYPPPPGASDIPGLEIAGRIVALGLGVHRHTIGEEVCALVAGGGYATHCLAPAPQILPVPRGLSMVE